MTGTHDLSAFLLTSLVLWITPGPDTMFILARSIAQGLRAGFLSVLGIGSGILVHTAFAAFGLSALLATSAYAFTLLKYAGAGYLIYLGIRELSKPAIHTGSSPAKPLSAWQTFRQGLMSNVLNPKIAIFFLAFLPQFVDAREQQGPLPFLLLGGVFVTGSMTWCLMLAFGAAKATRAIRTHPKAMVLLERFAGCVYLGLGLNLLRHKPEPAM